MKVRFIVLPVMLAGILSAQGHGPRGGSLTPPTPQELVQRRVDGLTKFFGLTTAQAMQVSTIITTEQSCLEANSTNLKSAREGLVAAIKGGSSSAISTAVGSLSSYQAVEEGCRATAAAAIYGGLTPPLTTAQLAKLGNGLGPLLGGGGPRFGPPPGH